MPKAKPLSPRAVEAARRVLSEHGVRRPADIHVEAIAARLGARVLYGLGATARGWIVRAGKVAIIRVDERAVGRPWARFTIAHELGHFLLHPVADHFLQCTSARERSDGAYAIEREASDCATELVMPEDLATPHCALDRATIDDVDRLARLFTTSLEMSAIRMTELTTAPCAVMVAENGRVKWASESLTFRGLIVKNRRLHPASLAARLPTRVGTEVEREVHGGAWGAGLPLIEHATRTASNRVLSWVFAPS